MYFDDKISRRGGLSWVDGRSESERSSSDYFEELERLAESLDDIESDTDFMTDLEPEDFDNGYDYIKGRIKELRRYIRKEMDEDEGEEMLDSLDDLQTELEDLYDDSLLYDL